MSCDLFSKQLEHYARGALTPAMEQLLEAHLSGCSSCTDQLNAEYRLLEAMESQAIPAPSADFESRVLAAATRGQGAADHRWRYPMMGSAIAAVLALGVYVGLQVQPQSAADQSLVAESTGVTDTVTDVFAPQEQTVKLAFHSSDALEDVTLTLELPAHVELASYPGRHRLSWQVNLQQGDNVLALPLKVLFPGEGVLVAHLDDGTRQKTFRAPIQDKPEPAS